MVECKKNKIKKFISAEIPNIDTFRRLNYFQTILSLFKIYFVTSLAIYLLINIAFKNYTNLTYVTLFFIFSIFSNWLNVQIHEASHYLLFKNKLINDLFCNIFYGFIIGQNVQSYRNSHLKHHAYLHSKKDPDFSIYTSHMRSVKDAILGIFYDLTLYTMIKRISATKIERGSTNKLVLIGIIIYQVGTFSVLNIFLTLNDSLKLYFLFLYSITAGFTILVRIRTICQHYKYDFKSNLDNKNYFVSRSTQSNFLEHLILGADMDFHFEHHLFPWIPHYHLKKLSGFENIKKIESEFNENYFNYSFMSAFLKLILKK